MSQLKPFIHTRFNRPSEEYTKYNFDKKTLLDYYKENMQRYLELAYPNFNSNFIKKKIEEQIKERFKPLYMEVVTHDREKNDYSLQKTEALTFATHVKQHNIISASGSCYVRPEEEVSLHSTIITAKQNERKVVKKKMIHAEALNDADVFISLNNEQMNIKVLINAISGTMLSAIFYASSWNYNAITANVRLAIIYGYTLIERFISSNIYFPNVNNVINYLTLLKELYPGDAVIDEFYRRYPMFKRPNQTDVYKYIMRCFSKYQSEIIKQDEIIIKNMITSFSSNELTFVFYASSLWNLTMFNKEYFKSWITTLVNLQEKYFKEADNIVQTQGEQALNDLINNHSTFMEHKDNDLVTLIMIASMDMFKSSEVSKELKDPRINYTTIKLMNSFLISLTDNFKFIFDNFFNIELGVDDPLSNSEMLRETVILSDTDSLIFTLQEYAKVFSPDGLKITTKTLVTNAIFIYIIFKYLNHCFNYLSGNANVAKDNISDLEIKNEYTYTVFLRSVLKKHYMGLNAVREGMLLSPSKLDVKGGIFKKSNLNERTIQYFNTFVREIMEHVAEHQSISYFTVVEKIFKFEQQIINSVKQGDLSFCTDEPIKKKEEYDGNTKETTKYFNYLVYYEIFSQDLGKVHLPAKFVKIPIEPKLTYRKAPIILSRLEKEKSKWYSRILTFLKKYPKKTLTAFYLPTDTRLPEELQFLINVKKVVANNMLGFYTVLNALGIPFSMDVNSKMILTNIMKELQDDDKLTVTE